MLKCTPQHSTKTQHTCSRSLKPLQAVLPVALEADDPPLEDGVRDEADDEGPEGVGGGVPVADPPVPEPVGVVEEAGGGLPAAGPPNQNSKEIQLVYVSRP